MADIIFKVINSQEIKISIVLLSIPIMLVCFAIIYTVITVIYFAQNARFKRINKKLEEYKQQNGEPINYDLNQPRIEMLRDFADYSTDEKYRRNINYEYELGEKEKYQDIIKKYGLDNITAGKKDLDLIFAIMKWSSEVFGADGNSGYPLKRNANTIMKHCKKNGGKINSHLRCIFLAEILRAYGIKAYHIVCLRFEEPHHNYNALVHAYSESLNKWIMLDPELNVYLKDKNNHIISIPEFRNIIITGEEFTINADAKKNWMCETSEKYAEFMATYLFRFSRCEKNYYGSDIGLKNNPTRHLIPEKYLKYTENFSKYHKENFVLLESDFWDM